MVGVGSNNSRGSFDNVAVQVLQPEITFEGVEEFPDSNDTIDLISEDGTWCVDDGWYEGEASGSGDVAVSLVDIGLDDGLNVNSLLDLATIFRTGSSGGMIFDMYDDTHFKFAGISSETGTLFIGHYTVKDGWTIDASIDCKVDEKSGYELLVTLKGSTVSATVLPAGGTKILGIIGYVYNAVLVDGSFGLFSYEGTSWFDCISVVSDDRAFLDP